MKNNLKDRNEDLKRALLRRIINLSKPKVVWTDGSASTRWSYVGVNALIGRNETRGIVYATLIALDKRKLVQVHGNRVRLAY